MNEEAVVKMAQTLGKVIDNEKDFGPLEVAALFCLLIGSAFQGIAVQTSEDVAHSFGDAIMSSMIQSGWRPSSQGQEKKKELH